jgi:hypothetical protein
MDTPPIPDLPRTPLALALPLPVPAPGSLRESIRDEIAACIARHGGRLDLEVCLDVAAPLAVVRRLAAELAAAGIVEAERVPDSRRGVPEGATTWQWRRPGWVAPPPPPVVEAPPAPPRRRRVARKLETA